jgi:hypothetical protein
MRWLVDAPVELDVMIAHRDFDMAIEYLEEGTFTVYWEENERIFETGQALGSFIGSKSSLRTLPRFVKPSKSARMSLLVQFLLNLQVL